jgi:predicted short-subunit dehydrogenase-like oxidoreductase (DUF2520 family)
MSAVKTRRPQQPTRRRKPNVVIVGAGRVGGALALGLSRAGWPISVLPHGANSRRRARSWDLALADDRALAEAKICVLAVPDPAVGQVAAQLSAKLSPGAALVHCAGALTLSAFGNNADVSRRPRGSFHPLRAVSDPRDDLSGHAVAISSNQPGLRALLRRMAADLSLTPLDVPESGRRAYHAGASTAAGGLVSLASAAVSALVRAGVDEQSATRALLPLMRSAIGGIERRGLRGALTGPIPRGDWKVVDQHLQALPSELRNLYLSLVQQSLRLGSPTLSSEATRALRRVLDAWRRKLKRRE